MLVLMNARFINDMPMAVRDNPENKVSHAGCDLKLDMKVVVILCKAIFIQLLQDPSKRKNSFMSSAVKAKELVVLWCSGSFWSGLCGPS